ncbi:hypothetical protein BDQ17DRAFT_1237665 [Cyathus striatus]|nr:hypothetical protein BDQ17DRAFT_1237665 [Cyathus striatus]
MGLRRTESYILLPEISPSSRATATATITFSTLSTSSSPTTKPIPYNRSMQFYKDQRQAQKKAMQQAWTDLPISPPPPKPAARPTVTPKHPLLQPTTAPPSERLTSPLAPTRKPLPCRPNFPRSKPDIDLYKKAIVTCMRSTPAGQQILRMGARNAVSVMSATRELERMVNEREGEGDIVMTDPKEEKDAPSMSSSWIVLKDTPATAEDWEMLDCTST